MLLYQSYLWFLRRMYDSFHIGKRRYNIKLWKLFIDCFNCLPVAALIDDRILCMHGGLSPELESIEQIKSLSTKYVNVTVMEY